MPLLAMDTSDAVAVAVVDGEGRSLASAVDREPRKHAERLAPLITRALADAGVSRTELTAVVVGTGPAPFTGLRVGLVTARVMADALGIPVLGICTLDALAAQAVVDLGLAPGTEIFVATDAKRREVYWARYRSTGTADVELVEGPAVSAPVDLILPAGAVVVGRGSQLYPEALPPTPGGPLDPDPAVLARLVLARQAAGQAEFSTEPLYLRRPDVTLAAGRKRATG